MRKIFLGIVAAGLLSSCQQVAGWFGSNSDTDSTKQTLSSESVNKAKMLRDESITKENAYSDLFLDSAALENYIQTNKIGADTADRMREFYIVRSNQFAWFTSDGVTEQARNLWSLYEGKAEGREDKSTAQLQNRMDSLLTNDSALYAQADTAAIGDSTKKFSLSDSSLVQTELALTENYVSLAMENSGVVTTENFYWLVPRKKVDAMQLADSLLNKQKDSSVWQNNTQYQALKNSLQDYYKAEKDGGWQAIPLVVNLQKGMKSPAVTLLKKRLAATEGYSASDTSDVFTDSLAVAIRTVQERYGFAPTGQVSDSLLQELNVPAEERLQQILVNMNRAMWAEPVSDSGYIMVNIPSQKLVVYNDSTQVMTMPVIVGKEGASTVAFTDQIQTVVFNPYWNIPQSIVEAEIKPAMQKDPDYLQKNNMEIVEQKGDYLQIRQKPGANNSLGQVKFLFPNSFDIYLHDTPNKELFNQQDRALSHGCIRVAQPDLLAQYVLRNQPEWNLQRIKEVMKTDQEQKVDVKNPVPVSITYYTAWTGKDGKLNFRRDLYGYDKQAASKMFINTSMPAATPA